MLSDAISYPNRGEDSLKTIVVGGVLLVLSFLVVPLLVLSGYYVRILEATAAGDDVPPAFDDWGDLIVTGVIAVVVGIGYYLIPAILFVVLGGLGALAGGHLSLSGLTTAFVVAGLVGVVVTYLFPAALTNYAREGRVGAAFAFGDLKSIVLSGGYFAAWVLGFLVAVAGGIVVGVLSLVPVIGTIVGLFVNFYIAVVAYRMFGTAYRNASRDGGESATATAPA